MLRSPTRAAARARLAATSANASDVAGVHANLERIAAALHFVHRRAAPRGSSRRGPIERAGSRSGDTGHRAAAGRRPTAPRNRRRSAPASRAAAPCSLEIERRRQLAARERDQIRASPRGLGRGAARFRASDLRRAPLRAIQIHEYAHLAAQDRGHDRRQDVVDRAELVAALRLHLVGIGRDEDDRRVRRVPCLRISSAVSMPSMSGMLTSSRMTANSRSSSSRSASAPDARARGSRRAPRAPRGKRAACRPGRRRRGC